MPAGLPIRDSRPDQIPAEELTQINYAFAQIDPDSGTILLEDAAQDKKNLAALRKLRTGILRSSC